MEFSIVSYSDVVSQLDIRLDADFYRPKYLQEDKQLYQHETIEVGDFSFVTDGQHGYHDVDENSPIFHLTAKNAKGWFANRDGADRIAKWVDDNNKRSSLQENDLILSTRGTVGYCALVKQNVLPANIDQDVARIAISSDLIIQEYLLVFLNCKFGQDWLKRNTTGMVQQGLSLQKVRKIPVPLFTNKFQNLIKELVEHSHYCISTSKKHFIDSQNILLSELNLSNWKPKHQLSFIKNHSEVQQTERIDAEFYQPKYEEIVSAIMNYKGGWETLDDLVYIKKCTEVGSAEYLEEGIPFVRVSNISPMELSQSKYISETLYKTLAPKEENISFEKSKSYQPQQGEILLSKDGTPGIAYYLSEQPSKMIPSGGLLRLKTKTNKVNNEFLTLVLNSVLTQQQVKRDVGGSIIMHWRPDQVKQTVIPILSKALQTKIQQKITESFALRKQSKHLLECAKKAVEMAIEIDEASATQWLQNEMDFSN